MKKINKKEYSKRDRQVATNIRVHRETKKDMEELGKYGDTADTIIRRLIAFYKNKNQEEV